MKFVNGISLTGECEHCCPSWQCTMQSEEILLAPQVGEMNQENSQTTAFIDANSGESVGATTQPMDYELADAQTSADLSAFLSRPVRIQTLQWAQSFAPGDFVLDLPVWRNFVQQQSILNKIQNYAFIRGNLKVKIVTNGSPFMYGALRAYYVPLPSFKSSTIAGVNSEILVPISQLPGAYVYPAHSEGVEMTLPFIWPRSFLRVGRLNDFNEMGKLQGRVYSSLKSANGSTSPVNVVVFAWMEDVVLAGPTMAPALQADEYGVGPVSAPASAIAAAAHSLSNVPVIGKFAKATEIGASAVSKVAKLFGFTNVPVIEETKPVRNAPFPQIASAEIGYTSEKLALDPKNELSIDPAIVGIDGTDELAIANFVTRESYLTQVDWSTAMAYDSPLFTSVVQPQLGLETSITGGTRYQFTPMGLCSTLFKNWRGDIIFRFKFVASPFHKGRVRISYDPYSNTIQTTGDSGPYVFNKIVDLGAETDVEMRIPFQQALPWLYTTNAPSASSFSTSTTPTVSQTDTFTNGMISVKVLTTLSAPVTTSSVTMMVFVRGAENLQFSNPLVGNYDLTPFVLQADEYREQAGEHMKLGEDSSDIVSKRALINFGENILSLRTLMRRQNLLDVIFVPTPAANTCGSFRISQTRLPIHYGFDPNGWNRAQGVVTPATSYPFNFVNVSPWHLISNCFLAQRGSFIWTYNPNKGSSVTTSRIARYNYTFPGMKYGYTDSSAATGTDNVTYGNTWKELIATNAGASVTHTATTNGHSIVAPSYSPFKFQSTDPTLTSSPGSVSSAQYDGTVYDSLIVDLPYNVNYYSFGGGTVERYFGIGSDYSLHFFMNCPTLYYLSAATVTPST